MNPLTDEEIEDKFRDAAAGLLSVERCRDVFDLVWRLETAPDVTRLLDLVDWGCLSDPARSDAAA